MTVHHLPSTLRSVEKQLVLAAQNVFPNTVKFSLPFTLAEHWILPCDKSSILGTKAGLNSADWSVRLGD